MPEKKVYVDGKELELHDGQRLNGIQAAQLLGIEVPHYCWHPGLSVVASCRMCLVESGRRNPETGEITMLPKVVPACQTPATDGTVFVTDSEKVRAARALVEEDLLIRHPIDCPICDKAGECRLQDYHFKHGRDQRRADIRPFTSRRRPVGDTVTLFVDRCVMCTRCVRFTREISGTSELLVINRGSHEEIDVFPGYPLDNKLSGNVVDLCPVGALGDVDFLYSQRVWFMKPHAGVCAMCSTGCSIYREENQDRLYRLKPRENPHVNQWWMCDEGRYGFKHVHSDRRQTEPRRRNPDGTWTGLDGPALVKELQEQLANTRRWGAVLSPHLTVEEAWLAATTIRQFDPQALLALGPVPLVGEDERFPNGFTIRAEKCPNRRGVEEILERVNGSLISFAEFVQRLPQEELNGVWVAGGYPAEWHDDAVATAFEGVPVLIVQDLFASPLWSRATYQLPGAACAERTGSYVNAQDRLQSFEMAVRPPAGVLTEGQLFWQLAGRRGLYSARDVLHELARQNVYFSAALAGVPANGIDLKANQLASV